jgi:nucleolar GTP-binding protein
MLLAHRVENKLKGSKIHSVLNRIHVAMPKPRDDVVREPFIPDSVLSRKKYDKDDPGKRKLERDIEVEEGGAGVYNINLRKHWLLEDPEWKNDVMPEIWEGKNVADFIDPDIVEKLEALEREEEKLEAEGFYDSEEDIFDSEDEREAAAAQTALEHRQRKQALKKMQNRPRMPRTAGLRTLNELRSALTKAGMDPSRIEERARTLSKAAGAKRKRQEDEQEAMMDVDEADDDWVDEDAMEVDGEDSPAKRRKGLSGRSIALGKRGPQTNRELAGMRNAAQVSKAIRLRNLSQRERNMYARAGESDRAIKVKMPKHLFAGKRKMGKTNRR